MKNFITLTVIALITLACNPEESEQLPEPQMEQAANA